MIQIFAARSPNKSALRRRRCVWQRSKTTDAGYCKFSRASDRTSDLAKQFIDKFLGKAFDTG